MPGRAFVASAHADFGGREVAVAVAQAQAAEGAKAELESEPWVGLESSKEAVAHRLTRRDAMTDLTVMFSPGRYSKRYF